MVKRENKKKEVEIEKVDLVKKAKIVKKKN